MNKAPLANENLNDKIENLNIFQDNNQYLVNMKINKAYLTLTLSEIGKITSNSFSKMMSLNELKQIHKSFSIITSCFDFSEYLKKLNQNKQLLIKKKENQIILSFKTEYLLNIDVVKIILLPDKINVEKKLMEACDEIEFLKQKIKNLEFENNELKKGLYYIDERVEKLIKNNNLHIFYSSQKPNIFYQKRSNY